MKLARKIIIVMFAAFLGVFAVLGYPDARRVVGEYHGRAANDLAATGRSLAPTFAEVVAVEGRARALQLLDRTDADLKHVQLHWVALDEAELDDAQRAALARGEEVTIQSDVTDEVVVYVPVSAANGAIRVSEELTPHGKLVTGVIAKRFAIGGIAVLVAACLAMLAAIGIVGAPMRQLANHARRVGAGDLSHRLHLNRRDEIGTLADEMNAMCEQLAIAQQRIVSEADAKLKAQEQVRHADRMTTVGTLAAGMAHELGTPLGIIAGRAKMITTADAAPAPIVRDAQIIGGQVDRMTKIMRGLLNFARHTPTNKAPTNLLELTKRIMELLGPLAAKCEVSLQLEPNAEPASADVDAGQIEQAVANLVVNGIQAMKKPGEVAAAVHRVHTAAPGNGDARDYVCISVRDAGSGIGKKDLPHIFEPFFTTKEVGKGTGLGLSVTYGIVHEHGGFVDVRSTVDSGTCVSLYFPT